MVALRRLGGWAGIVIGPVIAIASYALLLAGIAQVGLPILGWVAIGNAIFLVSGIAIVYGSLRAEHTALAEVNRPATRLRHLQEDHAITSETLFVWELIKPGQKPVVTNKTFTDCTINGPAMIALLDNVTVQSGSMGEGSLDSILHEMATPGEKQGVIGFISCTFMRCQFRSIGFYGSKELLRQIRAGTALV